MIGNTRAEDQADIWLREHDPYYLDKTKNKKQKLCRNYETPEQEHRRIQNEIPFSALSFSQMVEVGMDIKGSDGEYRGSM